MSSNVVGLLMVLLLLPLWGCGDGGTQPGSFRFGQEGQIRVRILDPVTTVGGESAELEQRLVWRSTGEWRLVERITYRGQLGDSTTVRSVGDPTAFASSYASLITLVNESEGLKLFIEELDPSLEPGCGPSRSLVAVSIRDETRDEEVEWMRCAEGSLETLNPRDAGPSTDPAAGRVIQAARLATDYVLGGGFRSAYAGTVPFATLLRREDAVADAPSPGVFLNTDGTEPGSWADFRSTYLPEVLPLEVDWAREMVIVATVGEVDEAGHEVEVRRILPVDQGTQIEVYHRIPGDFCSPASGANTPFHIVVAPRTEPPVGFQGQVRVELVRCGV